jgi:hypothetical protein
MALAWQREGACVVKGLQSQTGLARCPKVYLRSHFKEASGDAPIVLHLGSSARFVEHCVR